MHELTRAAFNKLERQYEAIQWSEYEKKLNEQDEPEQEEEEDGERSETGN